MENLEGLSLTHRNAVALRDNRVPDLCGELYLVVCGLVVVITRANITAKPAWVPEISLALFSTIFRHLLNKAETLS